MNVVEIILVASSFICIAVCCIMLAVVIRLSKGFNINVTVTQTPVPPQQRDNLISLSKKQLEEMQEAIDKEYSRILKEDNDTFDTLNKTLAEMNTFMTGGDINEQGK